MRLIKTPPALQHNPNRPEDVLKVDADEDGIGGDDAADALRYLVATKAREVKADNQKLAAWTLAEPHEVSLEIRLDTRNKVSGVTGRGAPYLSKVGQGSLAVELEAEPIPLHSCIKNERRRLPRRFGFTSSAVLPSWPHGKD